MALSVTFFTNAGTMVFISHTPSLFHGIPIAYLLFCLPVCLPRAPASDADAGIDDAAPEPIHASDFHRLEEDGIRFAARHWSLVVMALNGHARRLVEAIVNDRRLVPLSAR